MDSSAIAKQFVDFYYQTFDSNRQNLLSLYVSHHISLSLVYFVACCPSALFLQIANEDQGDPPGRHDTQSGTALADLDEIP